LQDLLHVNSAKRTHSVAGRCSGVKPLAERGLFVFCQYIATPAASRIFQPMQSFSIGTLNPKLNVSTRQIQGQRNAQSRDALDGQAMIRKRFARHASFSFFSNRRNASKAA